MASQALPFDPENPPFAPPQGTAQPATWRLAMGLFRAHRPAEDTSGTDAEPVCRTCEMAWPCAARHLAIRGLVDAYLHDRIVTPRPPATATPEQEAPTTVLPAATEVDPRSMADTDEVPLPTPLAPEPAPAPEAPSVPLRRRIARRFRRHVVSEDTPLHRSA